MLAWCRRRLRFSLAALLIAATLVAVVCGSLSAAIRWKKESLQKLDQAGFVYLQRHPGWHPRLLNFLLANVDWVDKSQAKLSIEDIRLLNEHRRIETMTLVGVDFEASALQELSPHVHVREIDLSDSSLDADALGEIVRACPRVQRLTISGTQVAGADLAVLQQASQLTTITVDGRQVDGPGVSCLSAVPRLETITLVGKSVDDACLERACQVPQVREIRVLWWTSVTDEGMARCRSAAREGLRFKYIGGGDPVLIE
jgi:hypothetical protein